MTITLRNTKGSELTFAELDGNFTDLDNRVQDSNQVKALIDSAYVKNIIDSSYRTELIDSAYVNARATTTSFYKYFYEADSGQTIFTDSDISGNVLSYDSATVMVYKNGMLLHELYDFSKTSTDTITLTTGMDSGHDLIITTWK